MRAVMMALVAVVVPVSVSRAIDLTVFQPSYAHVMAGDVGFDACGGFGASSDSSSSGSSSSLALGPSATWLTKTSSDDRDFLIDEGLRLNWRRYRCSPADVGSGYDHLTAREDFTLDWKQYFGPSDFLVALTPAVGLTPVLEFSPEAGYRGSRLSAEGSAVVKVGFGRFRDAWPLQKAVRLAGILQDNGVLDHEPRLGELLGLADYISRSWKLFYIHDRTAKFYYDSLDARLQSLGLTAAPLSPYVLMNIDDGLMVGSDERVFGSQVVAGAGVGMFGELDYTAPFAGESASTTREGSMWWHPFVEYRYAYPYGSSWTTGADIKYEFIPGSPLSHKATGQLSAAYNISNRLLAHLEFDVSADAVKDSSGYVLNGSGTAAGGFEYYLSDRLRITATIGVGHHRTSAKDSPNMPRTQMFSQLSLSAGPQWSSATPRILGF
jgi:hypothetical protein